jgi:RimJ/RimL family protein N-acetyltransferase
VSSTARLVYRAVVDTPETRVFLQAALLDDPEVLGLGAPAVLRPQGTKFLDDVMEGFTKASLMSVLVCLAPEEKDPSNAEGSTPGEEDKRKKKAEPWYKNRPQPEPIGVVNMGPGADPFGAHHRGVSMGVMIAGPWQGRGYGSEAINWALDWAFRRANMHRVGLVCYGYNARALHVYQRLGFVEEGRVREKLFFDNGWHDEVQMGMLKSEWELLRRVGEEGS